MSAEDKLNQARSIVERYHEDYGVPCTITGLTYNASKNLYEPPRTVKATGVHCTVASLSSIRDPDVSTMVRAMNISMQAYRRITMPYGSVAPRKDDHIIKEPVTATSDRYIVVEAIAPDETADEELLLHCQKIGVP